MQYNVCVKLNNNVNSTTGNKEPGVTRAFLWWNAYRVVGRTCASSIDFFLLYFCFFFYLSYLVSPLQGQLDRLDLEYKKIVYNNAFCFFYERLLKKYTG